MQERDDSKTSPTLLGRLALLPPDQAAWSAFVDRYGPRILKWCRTWGLQEADVLDVSQAVLTKLSVQLRRFDYDPAQSFRGWLRTIVRNATKDALSARGRTAGSGSSDVMGLLSNVEARDDLVRHLEEEFDLELLDAATAIVRQRIEPHTWEAYRLTAREGLTAAEAATRSGMNVASVFVAKGRVLKMLQEEVRTLEAQPPVRSSR
jgi:RNA polymerase sigma-70 factor (ECF subfamily)